MAPILSVLHKKRRKVAAGFDLEDGHPYDSRAMGNPLFDRRSPGDWASASQPIVFDEEVASFKRLYQSLTGTKDGSGAPESAEVTAKRRVTGELRFTRSAVSPDIAGLEGQASVTVALICQRCLKAMDWRLEANLALLLAPEGDIPSVEQDIWEIDTDRVAPAEIVDEALVMALPLVAKHDNELCHAESPGEDTAELDTTRPFADLRSRMEKKT
jgi:uncharacterized metal-binding protein YceD (DUF177 family)